MRAALERAWYRPRPGWTLALLPLAWLFAGLVRARRLAYRRSWLASSHPGVPVIVVGNLTVGGTGKTPLVARLARDLAARGQRPGIVSRGYGGHTGDAPLQVTADAEAVSVGDEPLVLARQAECPVVVCRRRAEGARHLVAACGVDVVLADDGLQHYALARDAEIAVCDVRRGYGNRLPLPAGPLREPLDRLNAVDLELWHGTGGDFTLVPADALPVIGDTAPRTLGSFAGEPVHAVAGIGDPERFFTMLRDAGLAPRSHAFVDHHDYRPADLAFGDDAPVLMTEKDAVKCVAFADARCWYVPVTAQLTPGANERLARLFDRVLGVVA